MIELTEEQRRAISLCAELPPTIIDPKTKAAYVLVPREIYDRLRGILDKDDARLLYPLLADLDPEDWEDISAYERKS